MLLVFDHFCLPWRMGTLRGCFEIMFLHENFAKNRSHTDWDHA